MRHPLSRLRRSPALFWLAAIVLAALTGTVVSRLVEQAASASARYGSLKSSSFDSKMAPASITTSFQSKVSSA